MAVQGPTNIFDRALSKIDDGTIKLYSDTFHYVLCTSSQALAYTFTGSSGDARYADLTGELVVSGYTAGGVALTAGSVFRASATQAAFTSSTASFSFGATPTFKYGLIVDWTSTNKDLVAMCDFDTGGGSISPASVPWAMNPDGTFGWFYWSR
jgi:hypothetical protein